MPEFKLYGLGFAEPGKTRTGLSLSLVPHVNPRSMYKDGVECPVVLTEFSFIAPDGSKLEKDADGETVLAYPADRGRETLTAQEVYNKAHSKREGFRFAE